jgi:putative thioredoxin
MISRDESGRRLWLVLLALGASASIAGCKNPEPTVARTPIAARPEPADPCARALRTLAPDIGADDRRVILVLFTAPWSLADRDLAQTVDTELAADRQRWRLIKSNVDEQPKVAEGCHIEMLPTLVAFVRGKPVSQIVGSVPRTDVRQFLDAIK